MSWVVTSTQKFQLAPQESLLEGLERMGFKVEYQCRSGYCGACRMRLTCGQVKYSTVPLAHLNKDEILPCCCVPETDIELNV